jgi:hypothetical protein
MSPVRMDRIESASRIAIGLTEAINSRNIITLGSLLTDDCIYESSKPTPDGVKYIGKEKITQYWEEIFQTTPNVKIEVEEIIGFGIRCVMRWNLINNDAIGKERNIRGVDIYKLKNGLITEIYSYEKGK